MPRMVPKTYLGGLILREEVDGGRACSNACPKRPIGRWLLLNNSNRTIGQNYGHRVSGVGLIPSNHRVA